MSPFEQVISNVAADAAFDKWPFRDGDVAHLSRWLNDGRATEIWEKLYPGAFAPFDAWGFITIILSFRQLAHQLDQANQKVSAAKRARKKATLADTIKLITELSAEGFVLCGVRGGALDSVETLAPPLAVRSDERGTRQRTIFCRLASMYVHAATGRWHDGEVAALCEIALDCNDVTTDMVRSYREAGRRDATRKRRRKA
jgi:hypothetical protein